MKIIYRFPTDQSVSEWNKEWEKLIRYAGHMVTPLTTIIADRLTENSTFGIFVGTVVSILKDEIQAQIPYPKVARGWRYETVIKNTFAWPPHPYGRRGFLQEIHEHLFDHKNKQQFSHSKELQYSLEEFLEMLARKLASTPPRTVTLQFK